MTADDAKPLLPILDEDGRPVLDIALVAALYYPDSHTPRTRAAVATLLREYSEMCAGDLRHWAGANRSDMPAPWRRVDADTVATLAALVQSGDPRAPWEFEVAGGERPRDATPFLISARGVGSWKQDMGRQGTFYFRLPWTWYAMHPGSFADLFGRAAALLRPNHGFAGLGFAYSTDVNRMRRMEADMFRIANSAPALVVEDYIFDTRQLETGTREGNWLTALNDRLLGQLGGADAVTAALGPEFACRRHEGGMTIQAGAEPNPIGPSIFRPAPPDPEPLDEDRVDHGVPSRDAAALYPLYHRLNQVLKPVRVRPEDFPGGLQSGQYEKRDYFDHARSMRWMARFD